MKRKLAILGLTFALAQLTAATLPPLAVVLAAALFVALGIAVHKMPNLLLIVVGIALGLGSNALFYAVQVKPQLALAGQTVRAAATIETDCASSYTDGMLRGTLHLTEIDGQPADLKVNCTSFPGAEPGECFTAVFTLEELEQNRYRMNHYANGVYLQAEYEGHYAPQQNSRAIRFSLYHLRKTLSAKLRTWLPGSVGGVEAAILLGDRSHLSAELQQAFRTAGVSHLLAVSGLHLALLCGLFGFGALRRRFDRVAIALQAVLVFAYMLLTGLPVSVQRAGVIYFITLLGWSLLQPPDLLTSLGAAALLLGLQQPYAPCDVGFQLSFCGVLGVQLAGSVRRWEEQHCNIRELDGWAAQLARAGLRVLDIFQTAVLASLATMPTLLAHDMSISGVSVLSNLLTVWMLRPALILGLLILALSALPWLAPGAHLLSLGLALWLKLFCGLVRWCASLPVARLCLPRTYTLLVLAVLAVLGFLFWKAKHSVAFLPVGAVCLALATGLGGAMQRDVVTVALVGTAGNPCTVLTCNGQAAVLFRGGAANQNAVQDYLWDHGSPALTQVVDLRERPKALDWGDASLHTIEDQPEETATEVHFWPQCEATLTHTKQGNLAVIQIGDQTIAALTGQIKPEEPLRVDVLCAAGSYVPDLRADTIVSTARAPRWLAKTQGERLLYGSDVPVILIRPNRSMTFEGVRPYVIQ